MSKMLEGVVIKQKMNNAVVVEVTRTVRHPKYKKLLKRSKKYSVGLNGMNVSMGDVVTITETKPISKTIHFIISKVHKIKREIKTRESVEEKIEEEKEV